MTDRTKFIVLAGSGALLLLLVLLYEPLIEPRLSSAIETSKRQRHYEQVIQNKGLRLHEGAFWKSKE